MRFSSEEVSRARTLKAVGFPWRPKIGDWYVDHTGYCDLVRTPEDMSRAVRHGNIFLPSWDDCRSWLLDRGWGHPEVLHEDDTGVTLTLSHSSGPSLRMSGASDLDCLYRAILMVQLRSPTRPPAETVR